MIIGHAPHASALTMSVRSGSYAIKTCDVQQHPENRSGNVDLATWAESADPNADTCLVKITITHRFTKRFSTAVPGVTTALAWDVDQYIEASAYVYSAIWPNPWLGTGYVGGNVFVAYGCCTQADGSPNCSVTTNYGVVGGVDSCFWQWPSADACCTGAVNFFYIAPVSDPWVHSNKYVKAWINNGGNVSTDIGTR